MIYKTKEGKYILRHGDLAVTIDPNLGARVLSVKLGDKEVLLQQREGLMNWGSTFWPAPQSRWNWPPPAAIQTGKYSAEIQGDMLVLEGVADTTFGFRVKKTFSFPKEKNYLSIDYQIFNDADSAQSAGPWEISCVPAEGLVFFPLGETPFEADIKLKMENINGIGFFKWKPDKLQPWQKVFNNASEGWLAHLNDNNVLFVKSFEKLPAGQIAPQQGNVEVFANKANAYIELENHGKYMLLQPGDSLAYHVDWFILQLSQGEVSADQKLAERVRDLIN